MSKCDNCIHVGVCHYIMYGGSDEIEECRHFEEERPQGEWICKGTEQGALGIQYEIKQCNKCGFEHSLCIPKNFCPNCGADFTKTFMRGDKNE